MFTIKRAVLAAGAVLGTAFALTSHAAIVGGIDFGTAQGNSHLEAATLAQTFINGDGQTARAYGFISDVNGANGGNGGYCAGGGSACGLYYTATFSNSTGFSSSSVAFTSAVISVYYTTSNVNLLNQTSPTNLATIAGMTPWLTLVNHGNLQGTGSLTGATLSGGGTGLFDVNTAGPGLPDVIAAFNNATVPDGLGGFADVGLTSSFNNFVLSRADVAAGLTAGCQDGRANVGAWCYQGTSNLRGELAEVPEPGTLALAGLGLGLAGMLSRRRRNAAQG